MNTYYPVLTRVFDDMSAEVKILEPVQSYERPENSVVSMKTADVYTDYFDTREEAEAFMAEELGE